ncbi:acyl carrier protein [Nocardia sp. NPDC046473]|uniref:acyl carrier protein n=1 Tax=Nocardia sp. NPDC046473 TaxID=3155733 RepID=UPI0033EEE323
MSNEANATDVLLERSAIEQKILAYLTTRLKTEIAPSQDIFAKGLVNSMFAMELVVQLEGEFGVAIIGSDLQLANFRSVDKMVDLVHRLREHHGE